MDSVCCTCAALLSTITPAYDEKTEKPKALDRTLECCGRVICGNCLVVGISATSILSSTNLRIKNNPRTSISTLQGNVLRDVGDFTPDNI